MSPAHNLNQIHYVYLLQSLKNGSFYVGCTSNLNNRIKDHNNGSSCYTKKYVPWELVYFEGYRSKDDAYKREKTLKLHGQGMRHLKERAQNSFI